MPVRRLYVVFCLLLAACGEAPDAPPEGYLNHAPEVTYTGKESCRSCHEEIYDSYVQTGMGRSLYRPEPGRAIEDFSPSAIVYDEALDFYYRPYFKGPDMFVQEFRVEEGDTVYRREEKVDFIVGSGHQTRSYLMERNGFFYEVPITWYVSRRKWDLSPGYDEGQNSRFDRKIGLECMACHTGGFEHNAHTVHRFSAVDMGIGCEQCHGPGQIHVERMQRDEIVDVGEEIDYSIVNPGKLPVKQQFDVCRQCHLQGIVVTAQGRTVRDFRPGMDLPEVFDIFIERYTDDGSFGIASHGERLMQSACFMGSGDELTCTTCHDPHKSISVTPADFYAEVCQSCHDKHETPVCTADDGMRAQLNNDCAACHMPKGGTSDIPHVTFTDHLIRVVRDTAKPEGPRQFLELVCMTRESAGADIRSKAYLLYFERNAPEPRFLEEAAQGLAPGSHAERAAVHFYRGESDKALSEIDQALRADSANVWLRFRKGEILESMGRFAEAAPIYEGIWKEDAAVAEAGLRLGNLRIRMAAGPQDRAALEAARDIFRKVIDVRPHEKQGYANLGFVLMNLGKMEEAEAYLNKALDLDPDYLLPMENLILLMSQTGKIEEGRQLLAKLIKKEPAYAKRAMMESLLK